MKYMITSLISILSLNIYAQATLKQLDTHLQSRSSQAGLNQAYQDSERIKQQMKRGHQRVLPDTDIQKTPQPNCGSIKLVN